MSEPILADLCTLVTQQVDPRGSPDDLYIGLEHLASGRLTIESGGHAKDVQSSKYRFQANDVLYSKLRPYLDKGALVEKDGVCTTELLVLRPKPNVNAHYLAALIHSPQFIEHAVTGTTGSQHPRTSWHHIANFAVQSLEATQQLKFAELIWSAHRALRASESALTCAQQVKRAAMRELFTRGLRGEAQKDTEFGAVPESWIIANLDHHAQVQTGAAKGRKFGNADTIEVPYLRVANVQDGHLDLREMKTIQIRESEVERYRLRDGDVVLTEGGDFDKLGRGFIWRSELDLCVHQNHVFAVRPDRDLLIPEFFAYQAQSPYGKAYFLKVAHKTTNLACINSTKLKAFPLLIPPTLEEQREIVVILQSIDAKIDLHKRKMTALEELLRALLHKLMTGEIRVADLDLSALQSSEEVAA